MSSRSAHRIGMAVLGAGWCTLVAAQEAEVFTLPEEPPVESEQIDLDRDADEVNIPALPGTGVATPSTVSAPTSARRAIAAPLPGLPSGSGRMGNPGTRQIEQFARIYRELEAIHARYQRLVPAADELERQSLALSGNAEMRAAIEQGGMSVADYNAISLRRWEDADVARRVDEALAATAGKPGGR